MRRRTISKIVNRFDTGNYQLPPDYQALVDSDRSICFRGLWFCVVFICLSGSCYQIWERILYYMSYPTAVDFEIGEVLSLKILTTQTCSGENDYVMDLLYDLAKSDPISCFIPAVKIWKMSKPVDYEKFWDYKNESISIDKVEFKNDLSLDYYMHTNKSFLGQCTTLEFPELLHGKKLNTVIVMKIIPPKLCPQSLTWFGITDKIDFAYLIPIVTGFRFDIKVSVRTYHFSSTFRNPCISDEEFMQCYKACVHRRIAKAECKLPFMDSSYQQLPCNNSDRKTAESSYLTNLNTILTPNIYSECKCLPACSQNVYGLEASIVAADNTELQVSLDQIAVTVTQRLAYDRNNLLTDIGGNLSLFMGLSLLAITDILQQVIMWLNRSHKRITMNRLENLQ